MRPRPQVQALVEENRLPDLHCDDRRQLQPEIQRPAIEAQRRGEKARRVGD